jgi:arylformamidase
VILTFQHKSSTFEFDSESGIDLSLPLRFGGENPSAFGVGAPIKKPYAVEGFVGSVEKGGSCNCDVVEFIPHCQGTHTECVGHVLKSSLTVPEVLKSNFFMGYLVSVDCSKDLAITAEKLQQACSLEVADAIIIRTIPNDSSKTIRKYNDQAPYLTKDAIEWMNQKKIQHLLVDFPSIDPIWDGGKLEAHRVFWNLQAGQTEVDESTWKHKTVTELIYAPQTIEDGWYALNIQASHFMLDAVPSSPIIYPLQLR